jgi:hypothetical protein
MVDWDRQGTFCELVHSFGPILSGLLPLGGPGNHVSVYSKKIMTMLSVISSFLEHNLGGQIPYGTCVVGVLCLGPLSFLILSIP